MLSESLAPLTAQMDSFLHTDSLAQISNTLQNFETTYHQLSQSLPSSAASSLHNETRKKKGKGKK
jgi:hypothetical protein